MASMVVRNIPDDVLKRFKERAKADGKSAEQLAREAIAEKAKPSREEVIRRIDAIRARSKPSSGQEIIEQIRYDREHELGRDFSGLSEDPGTNDDH
ncbi:MAG: FitA-like ribbon-helix-helix domain-containing protein [Rhizobiaceae bacterium]|jgi:plasmid stability protein